MSDIEYDQSMLIEAIIEKKMRPIYWIVGGSMAIMLTIFVTIALPLQAKLMDVASIQQSKADRDWVDSQLNAFVRKDTYYQIEEDEHRVLKEAIRNPSQLDYLVGVINDNILRDLGFKTSSRGKPTTN